MHVHAVLQFCIQSIAENNRDTYSIIIIPFGGRGGGGGGGGGTLVPRVGQLCLGINVPCGHICL